MAKMNKADILKMWREVDDGQNYMEKLEVVPYKLEGPKYGACGLRIEGTKPFIKAILSRLKDLLAAENDVTRLGISMKEVTQREDKEKENPFADGDHYCLYVRVHMRGGQARQVNAAFGMHGDQTEMFADLIGA